MRGFRACPARPTQAIFRQNIRPLSTYGRPSISRPIALRTPDRWFRSRAGPHGGLGRPRSSSTLVRSDAQRGTIYALSTPPGKAGVAVVRISGPDALQIWRSMVSPSSKKGKRVGDPEPWRMHRCDVVHPRTGELLDSGLAVYFKGSCHVSLFENRAVWLTRSVGPRSFTGEDVVELHVHSGRAIISSVLEALSCEPYCRLAEPGEFTRRAFQVGRLDLTEVEGLHDLINAETASQRQAALQAVGVSHHLVWTSANR